MTGTIPTVQHLIGGAFVDGDGKTRAIVDPATNEPCASVVEAGAEQAKAAVEAARKAFESGSWSALEPSKRGKALLKLAEAVKARYDAIAQAETLSMGKTIREAKADVAYVIRTLEYYAGAADKVQGETIPVPPPRLNYTLREPVGVTAHIAPWNYPLLLAVRGVAPALAAGNTVVWKPASQTPWSAWLFAQAAKEAGLPDGVLNVVAGPGGTVGGALTGHRDVRSVTFTGSCEVGCEVAARASGGAKSIAMEMGGKSPVIVYEDANLEMAVKGVAMGIFGNAGQMCWAGSRLIVQESVAARFLESLASRAKGIKVGPGISEESHMGPVVSKEHLATVSGFVERGVKAGAKVLVGGKRLTEGALGKGNFYAPTILTDVNPNSELAQKEVFGPVLSCFTFREEKEALTLANSTDFGLWGGVWTRDVGKAHRTAAALEAGIVNVNEFPITFPQTPFGGFKSSGIGFEQGFEAIKHYTRVKNVSVFLQ